LGIRLIDWWENNADPNSFTRSGVLNTVIRHNEMHHLGFRTDDDNAVGLSFGFTNKLIFEGNHVHHVAHNGVQFSRSVIQSNKGYGFLPSEIKTGEILIKDNIFEKACQQNTDCGALKFWGAAPQTHVFRDVLITGNIFRNTYGWSSIAEKRQRYTGGTSSQVRGMGGYGLFVDHASGLHAYRNIAYNNAYADYVLYGVFRDGDIVYWNNIAANSLYGFSVGGPQYDTHGSVNTQLVDNLIVNNEGYGVIATGATSTTSSLTTKVTASSRLARRRPSATWRSITISTSTTVGVLTTTAVCGKRATWSSRPNRPAPGRRIPHWPKFRQTPSGKITAWKAIRLYGVTTRAIAIRGTARGPTFISLLRARTHSIGVRRPYRLR